MKHELIHLPGIPEEKKKEIVEVLKRPEGTFGFRGRFEGLFEKEKASGMLMQVVTGRNILRLEREDNLDVNFIHSSPGTGTRIATVNIKPLREHSKLWFFLSWSPQEIRLDIGNAERKEELLHGFGRVADYQLLVGSNGSIIQVGDKRVQVIGVIVAQEGKIIAESTAINTWQETIKVIRILQTGTSDMGYIHENVVSCMSIVMLCTGFETYCKKRFLELVGEGIEPNYELLEREFFRRREREVKIIDELVEEARLKNHSLAQELVDQRRIDFGNYENCKDAFNKGYGIKFGEDLGVSSQTLEKIQQYIRYRHIIVHVSPLQSMLNYDRVPPEEPIFAKKETVEAAVVEFTNFIEGLHKATLELRP